MAGPTKLDIYQMAVRHLGDARFALITDDVETRYELDDAWDRAVNFVIRQAFWRFALKAIALAPAIFLTPGYSAAWAYPTDFLRAHAIYLAGSDGVESPIDLREQSGHTFTNTVTAPTMRYIGSDFLDPAFGAWPEQFAQVVAAYLAFLVAERVTGSSAGPVRMSQLFSSLLPEAAAIDAIAEDPWLDAQRDGTFLRIARAMAKQAFWRFATKTVSMAAAAGGIAGLANSVAVPSDWVNTRSLFVLAADGQRRPIDIREQGSTWYTNAASFFAQYISLTLAMDSTAWPDDYSRAVLRQIHFDRSTRKDVSQPSSAQVSPEQAAAAAAWKDALAAVMESEADPEDPWLEYQLAGSFARNAQAVITRGNWNFALKTTQIDASMQDPLAPDIGFPLRYALPADWLKTQALYLSFGGAECPIDIRQSATHWSTAAQLFTVRYLSTDALDARLWPEPLAQAVLAYLEWQSDKDEPPPQQGGQPPANAALAYEKLFADAARSYSLAEDPWLRFQLDGRFMQAVNMMLQKARWRFAVQSATLTSTGASDPTAVSDGSVSPGYTYRFNKPNDWMRTLRVYYSYSDGLRPAWYDVDYRDELDGIHANYSPLILRYISRLGLDSTRWPAHFRDAALAWLEHVEARADPKMAEVAAAKFDFFKRQCSEAENLDDESDVPRVINTGRFVAARYGRRVSTEQGWPNF